MRPGGYFYVLLNMKKISFCVTCKNRFHQIKLTLKKNLEDNKALNNEIEFNLVDFGSSDGLQEWVCTNFVNDLKSGYLKYYYTETMPLWHCPKAKNTAHLLADAEIVVNLDCDNFLGKDGASFVLRQFRIFGQNIILHQGSGIPLDGSFGRIAMAKRHFLNIGGYDESLLPMGYQDADIIHRLVQFGLRYVPKIDKEYNKAIPNTKDEGLLHTGSNDNYYQMNYQNMLTSKANISDGLIIANTNAEWGIIDGLLKYEDGHLISLRKFLI